MTKARSPAYWAESWPYWLSSWSLQSKILRTPLGVSEMRWDDKSGGYWWLTGWQSDLSAFWRTYYMSYYCYHSSPVLSCDSMTATSLSACCTRTCIDWLIDNSLLWLMYSVVFYITSLVLTCVLSTHNKRILYCIVLYVVCWCDAPSWKRTHVVTARWKSLPQKTRAWLTGQRRTTTWPPVTLSEWTTVATARRSDDLRLSNDHRVKMGFRVGVGVRLWRSAVTHFQ